MTQEKLLVGHVSEINIEAGRALDVLIAEKVMGEAPRKIHIATRDGGESAAAVNQRHPAFCLRGKCFVTTVGRFGHCGSVHE